jgi:hypothetical protein
VIDAANGRLQAELVDLTPEGFAAVPELSGDEQRHRAAL